MVQWAEQLDSQCAIYRGELTLVGALLKGSALALSAIAATLVHLPAGFIEGLDMQDLSKRCLLACESIIWAERGTLNVDTLSIKYVNLICAFTYRYFLLVVHVVSNSGLTA
jgi:hypothetical protein